MTRGSTHMTWGEKSKCKDLANVLPLHMTWGRTHMTRRTHMTWGMTHMTRRTHMTWAGLT